MSMFVRHAHMHRCKMQLHACGAVHVAGMLLGQGCFERQVEMCVHEAVPCVCWPRLGFSVTAFALHTCAVHQLAFVQ